MERGSINILNTIHVLEKYLEDFEKVVNEPIVPEKYVYRIGVGGDPVWKRIKKNHNLLDLLFGYGEKNARLFAQESKRRKRYPQRYAYSFCPAESGKPAQVLTIHDLDLPHFISYQIIDEQVEKYRLERKCPLLLTKLFLSQSKGSSANTFDTRVAELPLPGD